MKRTILKNCILWSCLFFSHLTLLAQNEVLVKFLPNTTQSEIDAILLEFNATELAITPVTEVRLWRLDAVVFIDGEIHFMVGQDILNIQETDVTLKNKTKVQSGGFNYRVTYPDRNVDDVQNCENVAFPCHLFNDDYFGNCPVRIGMMDTGIYTNHEIIEDYMWVNMAETHNQTDTDSNGYIDDIYGYNFIENSGKIRDDNGHGTHVTGIVTQSLDCVISQNTPNVQIVGLKTQNRFGEGDIFGAIQAMDYAMMNNINMVNMSLVWTERQPETPPTKPSIFEYVLRTAESCCNILAIVAAGNQGIDIDDDNYYTYPAELPNENIIVVGATNCFNEKADFSNYGEESVDIYAPGVDIYSASIHSGETIFHTSPTLSAAFVHSSGTSMATPFITAKAAIVGTQQAGFLCSFDAQTVKEAILNSNFNNQSYQAATTGLADAHTLRQQIETKSADLSSDVQVFPQPFQQDLQFSFYSPVTATGTLLFFNYQGQLILEENIGVTAGRNLHQSELTHLAAGVYVAKLKVGEETWIQKIVKN